MCAKKTAVMITCFEFYEKRMMAAAKQLADMGYDLIFIESDFRHLQRERRTDQKENLIFIPTKSYRKNLSFARINSHRLFAKAALKKAETLNPDLLYVVVPPNSLVQRTAEYKERHPEVTVIFDVLDLWPETLPIKKVENTPPYRYWKALRDQYLGCADHVFTECDLFRSVIDISALDGKVSTLYLSRQMRPFSSEPSLDTKSVNLAYLGSINNIIDIPKICALVQAIAVKKPVTVHVIGNGEKKDAFLEELKKAGAVVAFYGELYDMEEKQRIFDQCHFGINILKDTVCIGLTMKSIDYFECGLPVINSISGDTAEFIDRYQVGIACGKTAEETAESIFRSLDEEYLSMRGNCRKLFEEQFSHHCFERKFRQGMQHIIGEGKKP
jgi:glycosyltransferase involved in cell wall biosynthesis